MTGAAPRDSAFATTSSRLVSARQNVPRSAAAFLAIIAGLVVIKLVVARVASAGFASPSQAAAFGWPFLGAYLVLGLAGVWFASRTGFPETWDPRVPLRERLMLPAVVGVIFGAIALVMDSLTGWTAIEAAQHHLASIHIPWPMSLVIYPGGAAISNIAFYLVPIPVVMWLVGFATRDRWSTKVFWVVGALAAAIEPVLQDLGRTDHAGMAAAMFIQDYALNLAQVYAFRRAGFGASVVLRVTFYLVWHVLWGALQR